MSFTLFNRHESMNEETRSEILNLIKEIRYADIQIKNVLQLENMLYGMFDGYLYVDIQLYALELPTELCSRVIKVYNDCNQYPKLQTTI
jgi:hypothetical protein